MNSPVMHRNKSVMAHDFAMIPHSDVPRSSFKRPNRLLTTFDSGYLVPVYIDWVLPGDSFKVDMTAFARLTTPITPIMDNLFLDSFFFFVPYRLIWSHWEQFMGQQANPGDSISYLVPTITSPATGWSVNSLQDYFGWATVGQVAGSDTVTTDAFPTRAYNLIWNEWFRDENLQNSVTVDTGDGPDTAANYVLLRRGKRHDYFTSCLPWPQKGNTAVSLPLGTSAPIKFTGTVGSQAVAINDSSNIARDLYVNNSTYASYLHSGAAAGSTIFADLTNATAATINAIRLAVSTQQLLERDARGGTRYTEIVRSHFGVISPDARLQRPEYLGGGTTPVTINPVAQTSATNITGGTSPQGTLAAIGTSLAHNHGFTKSFVEHGIVLGFVSVRADLTYQQGVRRQNFAQTRYDYYFPAFAHLGEQAVLNREIYCDGSGNDTGVFGYQEAWAEYRYKPSMITGQFRSTYSAPLDIWHLSQKFGSLPTLNSTFIQDTPPVSRILAVGAAANGSQFYLDAFFDETTARPMPMYSTPGLDRL